MKKPRQLIIFAIVIIVVIGVSAAAAIFWSKYGITPSSSNHSNSGNATNQGTASQKQTAADQTASAAEKLAYDGNVQAGVQKLNDAIKGTTDTSQQFTYYSQLATLLMNNNQLPSALDAAKKAYALNPLSDSAALVGQIAQQMGDTATAIEYYQNAVNHIDPNDTYAKTDKTYYQGILDGLRGAK